MSISTFFSCVDNLNRDMGTEILMPSWEKKFCLKVGLFTWEIFFKAKRYVHLKDKMIH